MHKRGIATHMLAFEGDSHVEWFEGNYQDMRPITNAAQDQVQAAGMD